MSEAVRHEVFGWIGDMLWVNLTSGETQTLHPERALYHSFLGGTDLAARMLYDRIPAGADPLGPENVVALMTGPLTGTNFPGCGRISICALSPLTGLWGQSSVGGFFGVALKKAGWDGLLLQGSAPEPSYLFIQDDTLQILAAKDLWGRDTYDVHEQLRERHPRAEVICIGPAGENQVPMAAVAQRPGNLAGRTGMGAVLGSKNIKAIVVHGSGRLQWADRSQINRLVARANEILSTHPQSDMYRELGTAGMTEGVMMMGDMPVKNWSGEIWQRGASNIGGEAIADEILLRRNNCHACTVQCKAEVEVHAEDLDVEPGPGPEYETVGSLGTLLRHDDLPGLAKANELCNRYGLDTISTGSTLAWAMEAYERGDLEPEQLDGVELTWGHTPAILQAIEAMAFRRGKLGALLAQGSRRIAQHLGGKAEAYAINVKGLEMAMHHPRVFPGLALTYTYLPQGASHMEGGFIQRGSASLEKFVQDTIATMQKAELNNDLVLCSFTGSEAPMEFLTDLIEAVTGEHYQAQDLRACADRGYLVRYAFNLRAGHQPAQDQLPERILQQLMAADGRWEQEWNQLAPTYYHARGFDPQGYPTEETLTKAGLQDLIPDLVT